MRCAIPSSLSPLVVHLDFWSRLPSSTQTLRSEQDVGSILSSARETKHKHAQVRGWGWLWCARSCSSAEAQWKGSRGGTRGAARSGAMGMQRCSVQQREQCWECLPTTGAHHPARDAAQCRPRAQSLVEQARAYDLWVYERAMREVKYMNAPMPGAWAGRTRVHRRRRRGEPGSGAVVVSREAA